MTHLKITSLFVRQRTSLSALPLQSPTMRTSGQAMCTAVLQADEENVTITASKELFLANARGYLTLSRNKSSRENGMYDKCVCAGRKFLLSHLSRQQVSALEDETSYLLHRAWQACALEDITLAHVGQQVHLFELLHSGAECSVPRLSIEEQAADLFAVMGELDSICWRLQGVPSRKPKLEQEESLRHLRRILNVFVELIEESARDRLTYLKEAAALPSRRSIDAQVLLALRKEMSYEFKKVKSYGQKNSLSTLYKLNCPEDLQLAMLMQSGSIFSIWNHLHSLLRRPCGTPLIRSCILHQAPQMNKLRQLIVTRMAQVLCNFSFSATTTTKEGVHDVNESDRGKTEAWLANTILKALADSGVETWCYESESQKNDILLSEAIGPDTARKVQKILNVKVLRGFTQFPSDMMPPAEDTLNDWFSRTCKICYRPLSTRTRVSNISFCRGAPKAEDAGICSSSAQPLQFRKGVYEKVSDATLSGANLYSITPTNSMLSNFEKFENTVTVYLNWEKKDRTSD